MSDYFFNHALTEGIDWEECCGTLKREAGIYENKYKNDHVNFKLISNLFVGRYSTFCLTSLKCLHKTYICILFN